MQTALRNAWTPVVRCASVSAAILALVDVFFFHGGVELSHALLMAWQGFVRSHVEVTGWVLGLPILTAACTLCAKDDRKESDRIADAALWTFLSALGLLIASLCLGFADTIAEAVIAFVVIAVVCAAISVGEATGEW